MRNAIRLQKATSDIRYISKTDNNMLTLNNERFNLTETILQVIEDTRSQITPGKKNVNIIHDSVNLNLSEKKEKGFVIDGDKEGTVQAVFTILDNAAKFVKEGNATTISVDTNNITNNNKCNPDGDSKEIIAYIKDSCKGIDRKLLPRLFSKNTLKDGYGAHDGMACSQKHCRGPWWTHMGKE